MQYTVDKIENGVATVTFQDGSWAQVPLRADLTEDLLDELVEQYAPKTYEAPSFLQTGQQRTAAKRAEGPTEVVPEPTWLTNRLAAYGSVQSQIEYISENGLDAWQTHVAEIKSLFPKPE